MALLCWALWAALSGRDMVGAALLAGVGLLCWLLVFLNVSSVRSRAHGVSVPPAPQTRLLPRLMEAALVLVVVAVTAFVPGITRKVSDDDRLRVSLVIETQWHAAWLADHALEFQRASGSAPTSAGAIVQRFVQAETLPPGGRWNNWLELEASDPWRRPWVFQVDPGEAWVCSRGPSGAGECPGGRLAALPAEAAGSAGYSTKFGAWGNAEARRFRQTFFDTLATVAWVGPMGLYIVYRLVRRALGRPAQLGTRLGTWTGIAAGLAFSVPLYMGLHNAMILGILSARATADVTMFNEAIARYRAETGHLPLTLSSLAERPTARGGQGMPILDKERFPMGLCRGIRRGDGSETLNPFYTYRRWASGRYFIACPQPFQRPTVMAQRSVE